MPYLRIAFEVATAAALMRGWSIGLPFFWAANLIAALLNLHYLLVLDGLTGWAESAAWGNVWVALLPVATIAHSLAAAEAYQRTLAPDFWPVARQAGRGAKLVMLGIVLVLIASIRFMPPGASHPAGKAAAIALMAATWLKLWNAGWFGAALLFQALWPGLRIGYIRHALLLEGILLVQLVAALARLAGAQWERWHALNAALYLISTLLLVLWAAFVPPGSRRSSRFEWPARSDPGAR